MILKRILYILFIQWLFAHCSLAQCCNCGNYGPELVQNGNFSQGNTGFTTSYIFSSGAGPGTYGIATNANSANPLYWGQCHDHTSGNGNLLWFDLSSNSSINMWTQQIASITPNAKYLFSCWINTLDPSGPGSIKFSINGQLVGNTFTAPTTLCNWVQVCFIWNSGSNLSCTITITNQSQFASGNDLGVDDISFKKCDPNTVTLPEVTFCPGEGFQLPNGTIVHTPGNYADTVQTSGGCDSVTVQPLKYNIKRSAINKTICEGDTFLGYTVAGTYTNTFITTAGCDSIRTLVLSVQRKPVPDLGADRELCTGDSLLLHANAANCTYLWQNLSDREHYIVTRGGTYSVTATNNCGSKTDEVIIAEKKCSIFIPSGFTPNNDGVNDVFKADVTFQPSKFQLRVYNRWGKIVFQTTSMHEGWNGKFRGMDQPAGLFVWKCVYWKKDADNPVCLKGSVLLIR